MAGGGAITEHIHPSMATNYTKAAAVLANNLIIGIVYEYVIQTNALLSSHVQGSTVIR